jgi:hypothetical protein
MKKLIIGGSILGLTLVALYFYNEKKKSDAVKKANIDFINKINIRRQAEDVKFEALKRKQEEELKLLKINGQSKK